MPAYALYLYNFLEKHGSSFLQSTIHDSLSTLKYLSGQQKTLRNIEGTKFFYQFETYAQSVKESLMTSDAERQLDHQSHELDLFEKLAKLELTRDEWEEVKQTQVTLHRDGGQAGHKSQEKGEREEGNEKVFESLLPFTFALSPVFKAHYAFYENAESRDAAFLKNLTALMARSSSPLRGSRDRDVDSADGVVSSSPLRGSRDRDVDSADGVVSSSRRRGSVDSRFRENDKNSSPERLPLTAERSALLVAGGFHAHGITRRLKEQGISYLLVVPAIKKIPDETAYQTHMRGDVSWKSYFEVENGKVSLYKAFVRAVRDKLLVEVEGGRLKVEEKKRGNSFDLPPSAFRLAKLWRDQIIRDLAESGHIEDAGKYTTFLDERVKRTTGSVIAPEALAHVARFIAGLRDLKQKGMVTPKNILGILNPATTIAPSDGPLMLSAERIPASLLGRSEVRSLVSDQARTLSFRDEIISKIIAPHDTDQIEYVDPMEARGVFRQFEIQTETQMADHRSLDGVQIGTGRSNSKFYLKAGFYPQGNMFQADQVLLKQLNHEGLSSGEVADLIQLSDQWILPLTIHGALEKMEKVTDIKGAADVSRSEVRSAEQRTIILWPPSSDLDNSFSMTVGDQRIQFYRAGMYDEGYGRDRIPYKDGKSIVKQILNGPQGDYSDNEWKRTQELYLQHRLSRLVRKIFNLERNSGDPVIWKTSNGQGVWIKLRGAHLYVAADGRFQQTTHYEPKEQNLTPLSEEQRLDYEAKLTRLANIGWFEQVWKDNRAARVQAEEKFGMPFESLPTLTSLSIGGVDTAALVVFDESGVKHQFGEDGHWFFGDSFSDLAFAEENKHEVLTRRLEQWHEKIEVDTDLKSVWGKMNEVWRKHLETRAAMRVFGVNDFKTLPHQPPAILDRERDKIEFALRFRSSEYPKNISLSVSTGIAIHRNPLGGKEDSPVTAVEYQAIAAAFEHDDGPRMQNPEIYKIWQQFRQKRQQVLEQYEVDPFYLPQVTQDENGFVSVIFRLFSDNTLWILRKDLSLGTISWPAGKLDEDVLTELDSLISRFAPMMSEQAVDYFSHGIQLNRAAFERGYKNGISDLPAMWQSAQGSRVLKFRLSDGRELVLEELGRTTIAGKIVNVSDFETEIRQQIEDVVAIAALPEENPYKVFTEKALGRAAQTREWAIVPGMRAELLTPALDSLRFSKIQSSEIANPALTLSELLPQLAVTARDGTDLVISHWGKIDFPRGFPTALQNTADTASQSLIERAESLMQDSKRREAVFNLIEDTLRSLSERPGFDTDGSVRKFWQEAKESFLKHQRQGFESFEAVPFLIDSAVPTLLKRIPVQHGLVIPQMKGEHSGGLPLVINDAGEILFVIYGNTFTVETGWENPTEDQKKTLTHILNRALPLNPKLQEVWDTIQAAWKAKEPLRSEVRADADAAAPQEDSKLDVSHLRTDVAKKILEKADLARSFERGQTFFKASKIVFGGDFWQSFLHKLFELVKVVTRFFDQGLKVIYLNRQVIYFGRQTIHLLIDRFQTGLHRDQPFAKNLKLALQILKDDLEFAVAGVVGIVSVISGHGRTLAGARGPVNLFFNIFNFYNIQYLSNRQQGLLDTKRSEVRTDADALAPQADSKLDVSHLRNQAVALEKEVENAMLYPANLIHSRSLQLDVYDREHYAFVPSKANPEEGYWRRNGLPSGTELVLGTWQDIQKKYGPEYKDHQSMKRHVVTRYKTPEGQTRSFYFYDDHAFSVPYALEALERPNEIAASEGLTHLFLDDHSDRAGVPQVIFPKTFAEAVHLMADKETLNGLRMNNFNAFWAPGLLTRHVHLYDSQVALPSDYQRLSGQIKIELPLPGGALSVSMDTPLYFSQYSDRPRDDQNSVFVDVDTDINGGGDSVTKPIRPADEIFSFYSDVFGRLVFDDKVSPALFHASTTTSPHASYGDVEIVRYLARVAPLFFIAGPLHARDEILTAVKAIGTEHKDLIRRSEVRKNRAGFTPEQQQVVRETAEWFIRSQRGFRNDLAGLSEVEQKRVDQLVLKTRVMRKTLRGFLRMAWWRWRSGLSQVLQQKANIPLGLIWMFGLTLTGAFSLPLQFFVYVVEPYWAFGLANRNSGIVEISPEALTNTRLFKKVLIHEWVHLYEMNPRQAKPAQNDNDALGFIAQLENAQVAFTEESILNAYPSPLLKSAFKSIQDQGFQTTLEGYRNVGDIERRKALFAAELHFKEGFYSGIRLPRSEGLHKTASILYKTYTQTVSEYFKLFFAARLNLARQITTREAPIEDYVAQTGALALMLHAVNTQFPEASDAEKYHLAKVFFWASLDIGLELGLRSFDRRIKTTAESSLHSHWRMRVDRDGLQRVIEAYPNIRRELFEELDWIVQKAEVLQPDVDPRVSIDLHVKPLTDRSYLKEWKIKKSGRDEYSFWLSIQSQADRNHWISHELFILKKNAIFPKRAEVRQSGQPPARKPAQNTIGKALARELFGQIVQDGMVHSDTAEDVAGLSVVRLDEVIQRLEMMLENARADWHAEGLDGTAYVAASLGLISELLSIVQKLKTEYPEGAEVGLAIAEGIDRLGSEQIADQHARALTSLGGLINRMIVIGRLSAHFQEMLNESGFKGIKLTLEGRAQNVKAPDGQARVPVVEVGDSLNGGIIPPEILRVLLGQEGYDMGADTYSFYTLSAAVALQYAYSVIVALKLKKEMDPAEISQELLDQLGLKTENALVMDGDKMRVMVNVVRSLITEFQTRSEIRKAA